MAVGGDITEITVNHPTLGSRIFFAKANEGNTYDVGGIRTEDDADSIDGGGNPIWKKNRKMGFFEVVVANDQSQSVPDADFVATLAADPVQADWTFSIINGSVYGGSGKPVGDIQPNVNDATFTLKVLGATFKKIS
jgi:hypothetical protein